jgi:uncharacterized protein DUF1801
MSGPRRPRRPVRESGRIPAELTALLRRYDPPVRELALRLREVVLCELGPCHERIYDAGYAVAVWYSYDGRVMDSVCYIGVYRQHVNLGFHRGSRLPNPHGLLQGTGAWMRHIKMRTPADIARPELRDYLKAAIVDAIDDPVPNVERPVLRRVVTTVTRRTKTSGSRASRPGSG